MFNPNIIITSENIKISENITKTDKIHEQFNKSDQIRNSHPTPGHEYRSVHVQSDCQTRAVMKSIFTISQISKNTSVYLGSSSSLVLGNGNRAPSSTNAAYEQELFAKRSASAADVHKNLTRRRIDTSYYFQ